MYKTRTLPPELQPVREAARRALGAVLPARPITGAEENFLFDAKRSEAGRALPPYYLVYFLLVELLGFRNLGKFEKVSWSIPIDFHGRAYLIEHRKFGVGVFVHDPETEEMPARQIVLNIKKAVKVVRPFFDWLAERAVEASAVNVINNGDSLFARFNYFLDAYTKKAQEARDRKNEKVVTKGTTEGGGTWTSTSYPAISFRKEARWLALAAIEAFFSWTEHVFIHIAILSGNLKDAKEVACLAEADWSAKFKRALDISDPATKDFLTGWWKFEEKSAISLRTVHSAKRGKLSSFIPVLEPCPVLLPHRRGNRKFMIGGGLTFDDDSALKVIEGFIQHLWAGPRAPAKVYIQQNQLPIILPPATDHSTDGF